jgi:very-short-patch-repair endonuclease
MDVCRNGRSAALPAEDMLSLRRLQETAKNALRERGERSLHIALGRFEMPWPQDPTKSTQTPMYLLKVQLVKVGASFRLDCIDEDKQWELNPVVRLLLSQERMDVPTGNLPDKINADTPDAVLGQIRWLSSQCAHGKRVDERPVLANISSADIRIARLLSQDILARALSNNAVVAAKLSNRPITADGFERGDKGIEELGIVLPCDDSQLRVIQLTGQSLSLQVEGPPGTGKSQTIANVIANLILGGKKVLFVCDKEVAVKQVQERLDKAGLGAAVMFLHDEDTKRLDFTNQANVYPPDSPEPHAAPLNNLRDLRAFLNQLWEKHRGVLHPAGSNVNVSEGMDGLIRLRRELGENLLMTLDIPGHATISFERLQSLRQVIEEWAEMSAELAEAASPWNKVRGTLYEQTPAADNLLQSAFAKFNRAQEQLPALKEGLLRLGVGLAPATPSALAKLRRLAELVRTQPPGAQALSACQALTEKRLASLHALWLERRDLQSAGYPLDLDQTRSDNLDNEIRALRRAIPSLQADATWADLASWSGEAEANLVRIDATVANLAQLSSRTGCAPTTHLEKGAAACIRYIGLRHSRLGIPAEWWNPACNPVDIVTRFQLRLAELSASWQRSPWRQGQAHELIQPGDLRRLVNMDDAEFAPIQDCVDKADELLGRLLRPSRKGKNLLRTLYGAALPAKMTGKDWDDLCHHTVELRRAVLHLHQVNLEAPFLQPIVDKMLSQPGAESLRTLSNHELMGRAAALARTICELRSVTEMASQPEIAQAYWRNPDDDTDAIVMSTKSELDNALAGLSRQHAAKDLKELRERLETQMGALRRFLDATGANGTRPPLGLEATLAAVSRHEEVVKGLAGVADYASLTHAEPSWHLASDQDWATSLARARWRDELLNLTQGGSVEITPALWVETESLLAEVDRSFKESYAELGTLFDLGAGADDMAFESAGELLSAIRGGVGRKRQWLRKHHWIRCLSTVPELGPLWTRFEKGSIKPATAWRNFLFYFLQLCKAEESPHGPELEGKVADFRELDGKLSDLSLARIRRRLREMHQQAGRQFPDGKAALRHYVGLQRIVASIREILQRPEVMPYLTRSKPCWMMSPASLSAYLGTEGLLNPATGETYFDCVIFDEASQMRVMEAVYCMSYAPQTVIVGDKKQLPPTNFFRGSAMDEDDAEESVESVLEEFGGAFNAEGDGATHVSLMSHYRSDTPDLIQFNNRRFYDDKLEICPPRVISGTGLNVHHIPEGRFLQRRNEAEAAKVVELVARHAETRPGRSLGVVVMNYEQMELIETLLERAAQQVRTLVNNEQMFFLRNLETVQGDEADHIILSLTYGKGESGRFSANVLGPIVRSGGERRLNVATSRSKMGMDVVTSLTAGDLAGSSATSVGFACFQEYLRYLDTVREARDFGINSLPFETRQAPTHSLLACDSCFEVEVAEFIQSKGIVVLPQYGAGRYRIDLVVQDGGRNILAVECDGAAYHSTWTARTRDRMRQRQLESRGWRFHRIWSRNWYHERDSECQKLLVAIQSARLNPQPQPRAQ